MKTFLQLIKNTDSFKLKPEGKSMLPTLHPGDIVFIKKINVNNIKLGDIIFVSNKKQLYIHRVVYKKINSKGKLIYLITKGDNNIHSDGKVFPKHIQGIIYQVKRNKQIVAINDIYLIQSSTYLKEITLIKNNLENASIEHIFLKGLPLHLYYEKTVPKRIYYDCDILVKIENWPAILNLFTKNGYKMAKNEYSPIHKLLKNKLTEVSLYKWIGNVIVVFDVHFEPVFLMNQIGSMNSLYPDSLRQQLTNLFFEKKRNVKVNNQLFSILSSEHLIVYLCLHYFHHNYKEAFRLNLIFNIISQLNNKQKKEVFNEVEQIVITYKLENFIYPTFILLKKYFNTTLLDKILSKIKPNKSTLKYIHNNILNQDVFSGESKISGGINRFKNIFFLSPNNFFYRIIVFINPAVIFSIFWVIYKIIKHIIDIKKYSIHITVFTAGACLMILELTATRIIAPFFGNSIFTWTSLIGIILGCLSLGYSIGGKYADKKANFSILSTILTLTSLSCILIYFFSDVVLNYLFSLTSKIAVGSVLSTIILFSIPSTLFGLISPYAAKLKLHKLSTTGKSIGNLYAISTIGSIAGTFITGFYLLSVLGSHNIILLVAIILLINSLLLDYNNRVVIRIILLIFTLLIFIFYSKQVYRVQTKGLISVNKETVLKSLSSAYSNYYILQLNIEKLGKVHALLTDFRGGVHSAETVQASNILLSEYQKYLDLSQCYENNDNVLMIGGGGFSYAKYFLNNYPQNTLDVVEIDPKLTEIAMNYFNFPKIHENVHIINLDGRQYLNQNTKIYNTIILDAFDSFAIPFHIITKESLIKTKESLSEDGMIIINMVDNFESNNSLLQSAYLTVKSLYPLVDVYRVHPNSDSKKKQNVILIGFKTNKNPEFDDCIFNKNQLDSHKVYIQTNEKNLILTDDFAPVEYLIEL